jgi:ankyrin repeat protein
MKYLKDFNNVDYKEPLIEQFWRSITLGKLEKVKDLLKNGVDPNVKYSRLGKSFISYAVDCDNIDIVKELLKYNVDINSKNKSHLTPLFYAINNINYDMVKLLINSGADVNVQTKANKNSPIIVAAKNYENIHDVPIVRFKNYPEIKILELLTTSGAYWRHKNSIDVDFFYYLDKNVKKYLIEKFPEKYNDYMISKNAEKYNL